MIVTPDILSVREGARRILKAQSPGLGTLNTDWKRGLLGGNTLGQGTKQDWAETEVEQQQGCSRASGQLHSSSGAKGAFQKSHVEA